MEQERDVAIYLERVAGRDVGRIAKEYGVSRQHVHRIVSRVRSSGLVKAHVGVSTSTVEGIDPAALGDAFRRYARSMGIEAPEVKE